MGNASSSSIEATPPPRKTPHKLSKPRVGNHASTTAGLLSSHGCLAPSIARPPNSSHDDGEQRRSRRSSFLFSPRLSSRPFSVSGPASEPAQRHHIEPVVTPSVPDYDRVEQPPETPLKNSFGRRSFLRSKTSSRLSGEQWLASTGFTVPRKDDGLPRVQSMIHDPPPNQNYSRPLTGRLADSNLLSSSPCLSIDFGPLFLLKTKV